MTLASPFATVAAHTEHTNTKHIMRTKALLLTAALGLASVATSMAQVYSVNVVGYINVPVPATGFALIANQLNASPNNSLNSVLTGNIETESQVLKFANNNYLADIYDGSAWVDFNTGAASTTTVAPGEGFFFYNAGTARSITLVGEVRIGNNLNVTTPPGQFNLMSSIVPQDLTLDAASGFPTGAAATENQFISYNAATQGYNPIKVYDGAQWVDFDSGATVPTPSVVVGQGFFFYNAGSAASVWSRNFNPN